MLEKDSISRIKVLLKAHPKGLTITDISSRLTMNRNSVAKYLEVLLISGQVETQSYGTARVFFLTHRIPISAMLSISSHLVLTVDESKKVIFCNDNFLTFFGIARDQIVGHHIIEIYRLGVPDITFSDLFSDILVNPDHTCETAITKQSETYYFQIKGINTVFDDGCRGITIVMKDVTKEQKHRLELEINEARYRGIVEDQTDFICRFLPDGTLTFINNSFAKFLSRTPEVLVNKCQIPGISCEDTTLWDHACKTIDREHAVTTIDCRMPDGTGRICWTAWTIRGLFDESEECREYQAVGRDITEKKEAHARFKAHVTEMEFFSRKLQDFTELAPDANIYEAIGTGVYELIPNAAITVNSYDHGSGTLTVRAVLGEQVRDSAARIFGKHVVGYAIRVDENVPEPVLSGKVHHIEKDLYNILFRHLPKEACKKITIELNLGEFYSVGLVWNGVLFGNITFGLQKGVLLTNTPLIEIYAQAASIALQRRIAEDKLKESEKKRAEEAVKSSENYLRTIFNSTQSGLVVIDPETHTLFDVNSTAIELIGKKKSEIVGSSCKALFCLAEGDTCPVTDLHQKVVRKECNFLTNTGEKKVVLKTVVPVQIGDRLYLLESILDISERKKAEDALVASEGKFRETVRMLDEGYYNCSPDGKLLEHNLAFNRILGIDPAHELSGISLTDFWQDPVQRQEYLAELTKKGFIKNYLVNAKTIRGDKIIVLANAHTVPDESGRVTRIVGTFTDFTARKRVEDALRESEERYRSLAETAQDFIYIIDKNDNVVYVNSYCQQMLKKSREDIIGKPRKALFPEPVATVQYQNLQQVFTTGIPLKEVNRVPIAGQEFWQDTQLVPLKTEDGTISAVLGISRDITRLKQIEEALRESEEKYRNLFENAVVGVFRTLPDGRPLEANTAFAKMFGYRNSDEMNREISNITIQSYANPDDRMKILATLKTQGYLEPTEVQVRHRDGHLFYALVTARVIRDPEGRIFEYEGTLVDISERKRAEEALRGSEKKFRDLADMLPQSVWECDTEGNLTFVNRRSFEMYGYDLEDFDKGLNIWQMMHPDDRERVKSEVVQGFMHAPTEFPEFYQYTALRKEGSTFPIEIYATVIVHNGQPMGMRGIGIDITERRQVDVALRESEGKINAMLQSIPDHMSMMDKDLNIIWPNDAAKQYFGKDLVGRKCYEVYHQRQNPCEPYPCLTLKAFQDGQIHRHETSVIDIHGQMHFFECSANVALNDDSGKPIAVFEISRNITERKQAEVALFDTEERYKSLFDRSHDCVYLHDFTGNYIDANPSALTLLGYTRDEITSLNFTSLFSPDQVSAALKVNQEVLANGTQKMPTEFRVRRKDGGFVDVITTAALLYKDGKPYAIQGIAHDITERKRVEAVLHESEKRFRSIVETMEDAYFRVDREGIIQMVNPAAPRTFGYGSVDEMIGIPMVSIYRDPGMRDTVLQTMQKYGIVHDISIEAVKKDGTPFWTSINGQIIYDNQGNFAGSEGFVRDIVERKRVEEALRESEEKFRILSEQSILGIGIIQDGIYQYFNQGYCAISGYSEDEIRRWQPYEYAKTVHPDDLEVVMDQIQKKQMNLPDAVTHYSFRGLNKEGAVLVLDLYSKTILYQGRPANLVTFVDITERKRAEDKLRESED